MQLVFLDGSTPIGRALNPAAEGFKLTSTVATPYTGQRGTSLSSSTTFRAADRAGAQPAGRAVRVQIVVIVVVRKPTRSVFR